MQDSGAWPVSWDLDAAHTQLVQAARHMRRRILLQLRPAHRRCAQGFQRGEHMRSDPTQAPRRIPALVDDLRVPECQVRRRGILRLEVERGERLGDSRGQQLAGITEPCGVRLDCLGPALAETAHSLGGSAHGTHFSTVPSQQRVTVTRSIKFAETSTIQTEAKDSKTVAD